MESETAAAAELRKQGGGAEAADAPGKPDALRTAKDAASSKDEDIDQLPSADSMESLVRARAAARADARAAPRAVRSTHAPRTPPPAARPSHRRTRFSSLFAPR